MSKTIGEILDENGSNVLRSYYALDEAMMKAHFEDNDEYAESTARILLDNSDLLLLLRSRACMVLACSDAPNFLDMAHEAVRIAQLGYDRCTTPGELEKNLVKNAKDLLVQSETRWQEIATDDEEEGELVWEAAKDQQEAGGTQKNVTPAEVAAEPPATIKSVTPTLADSDKTTRPLMSPTQMERQGNRVAAGERQELTDKCEEKEEAG